MPLYNLPGSLYQAMQDSAITFDPIMSLIRVDGSGYLVGDAGDVYCGGSTGCTVWDPNSLGGAGAWVPATDVYPPMAQGLFQGNPQVWAAANQITDPRTIASFYGLSAAAGVVGLASPEIGGVLEQAWYNPEIMSNVTDFFGGFDPNPAAPFAATVGGVTGWVVSGGAKEWWNATTETVGGWWNGTD
jgi:hypothetical protein